MDLTESEMEILHHFSHQHPLVFFPAHHHQSFAGTTINCFGCDEIILEEDGGGLGYYGCKECKYYLHKECGESKLAPQIDHHPFHPEHPLSLFPKSPYDDGICLCDFCHRESSGFVYHCDVCKFDLHVNCALLQSSIAPSSLHHHPLFFLPNHNRQVKGDCLGCKKPLSGPIYHCSVCSRYNDSNFNLHKGCAELAPQIDHPFHPQHLLSLLPKSPYDEDEYEYPCRLCGNICSEFLYHCDPCDFDLHVNCASVQSSIATNFPNSLHHHPLFFLPNHNRQSLGDCYGCDEPLSGPIYHCSVCSSSHLTNFNLHKECGELELASQIDHPFHPQHLLTLFPKSLYDPRQFMCNFCGKQSSGFFYHCGPCKFDLHVRCALLQSSIAPNFPNSLHHHPLIFVQNHDDQVGGDCSGCKKPLSGPIYYCSVCRYPSSCYLHKECAELPLEINHPYDRNHPLSLLLNPPTHPLKCSCYLCKIKWEGFVYSCSLCKFEFSPEDVCAPRTITDASHQHPWTLISRQMSFNCDFCGTAGDLNPYLCATCDLFVHKNCITLPRRIMITRHHHVISHSYSLPRNQFEDWICRICYEEVDKRYGCYYCARSSCNYIAHVHCATHKTIWDGTIIPEDCDESSMEADSSNMITNIFEEMSIEEQMVAVEIKHAYHEHNLRLTFSDEIKDEDSQCDGCMRSVSTPFYSCDQCKFFLHKDCAELPREKRHPFHKHSLTLIKNSNTEYDDPRCCACKRPYHGFSYQCYKEDCELGGFIFDLRCMLLLDTLKHPSHEHSLFLVHHHPTKCSGCLSKIGSSEVAYRCMKRCNFALHIKCATEPLTTSFKYDKHPLTLTYSDDSSLSQHYCDLCEEERDPKDWFYYCSNCDNSLHSNCALGDPQFMKLGSKIKFGYSHRHPLVVVKNIWNCPPCKVCDILCSGPALECKESECNFTVHWECAIGR